MIQEKREDLSVQNYDGEVSPFFQEKNVAVVFEASAKFLPYVSVAILSMFQTITENRNYDILVLSSEANEADVRRLLSLANGHRNVSIRVIDPSKEVKRYIEKAKFQYLEVNYFRMALPWILKNYKRVINLGADILIRRDISDFYNEPLQEWEYIAGARDVEYQGRLALDISPRELGLRNPKDYVNADVLLFDLEKIRKNYCQEEVMSVWQLRRFRYAEQDALNYFFQGHIRCIDLSWNVFPRRMSSEFDILHAPCESQEQWRQALDNPNIIHFAAIPKPWEVPTAEYGDEWWCIAKESPYYREIVQNMQMYLRENVCIELKGTHEKGIATVMFPRGSFRRRIVQFIVPKGSALWCMAKRIQYRIENLTADRSRKKND